MAARPYNDSVIRAAVLLRLQCDYTENGMPCQVDATVEAYSRERAAAKARAAGWTVAEQNQECRCPAHRGKHNLRQASKAADALSHKDT